MTISENEAGVLVRYRGISGRRVIGDYVWSVDNKYECRVDDPAVLDVIRADLRFVFVDDPTAYVAPDAEAV